jgi:hypothetical protein
MRNPLTLLSNIKNHQQATDAVFELHFSIASAKLSPPEKGWVFFRDSRVL